MACTVNGCSSRGGDVIDFSTKISLHRFPFEEEIKAIWVKNLRKGNKWEPTFHTRVCSLHFEPSCFRKGFSRRTLHSHAVPTIFPDRPLSSQPKLPKRRKLIAKYNSPIPKNNYKKKQLKRRKRIAGCNETASKNIDEKGTISYSVEQVNLVASTLQLNDSAPQFSDIKLEDSTPAPEIPEIKVYSHSVPKLRIDDSGLAPKIPEETIYSQLEPKLSAIPKFIIAPTSQKIPEETIYSQLEPKSSAIPKFITAPTSQNIPEETIYSQLEPKSSAIPKFITAPTSQNIPEETIYSQLEPKSSAIPKFIIAPTSQEIPETIYSHSAPNSSTIPKITIAPTSQKIPGETVYSYLTPNSSITPKILISQPSQSNVITVDGSGLTPKISKQIMYSSLNSPNSPEISIAPTSQLNEVRLDGSGPALVTGQRSSADIRLEFELNSKIRQLESKVAHLKHISESRNTKLKNLRRQYSRLVKKTATLKQIIKELKSIDNGHISMLEDSVDYSDQFLYAEVSETET